MSETKVTAYDPIAQTLHWSVALAVFIMFVSAMMMDLPQDVATPELRMAIYTAHKSTGILVLVLMILRILWFMRHERPPLPVQSMPVWQVKSARFVHASLYIVGILTPLAGWMLVSMGTHPFTFYGLFDLPRLPLAGLVETTPALGEIVGDIHATLATAFAGLIVVHIGATILHHFVDRDDILMRMTPVWSHRLLEKIRGH